MELEHCPLHCLQLNSHDFLQRNGAWVLTVVTVVTGCFGAMLTYFLKSRCRKINVCCGGLECERAVVELEQGTAEVKVSSDKSV